MFLYSMKPIVISFIFSPNLKFARSLKFQKQLQATQDEEEEGGGEGGGEEEGGGEG
jgi:hypothetical protein